MPAKFAEVVEGLCRGGRPSREDLNMLRDLWGVRKIVSLDDDIAHEIAPIVHNLGLKHIILGLGAGDDPMVSKLYTNVVPNLLNDGPTYIHCKHGKDRTGMAVAMFRVFSGWSVEEALKEAAKFGMGFGLPHSVKQSYYDAVKKYSRKLKAGDLNDNTDIVETVREQDQHNPAINDSSISNFGRGSFAPFDDPNASRLSRIAERGVFLAKAAKLSNRIFCKCKPGDMLKNKQLWYRSIDSAKKSSDSKDHQLFSASLSSGAKVEDISGSSKKLNDEHLRHLIGRGVDAIRFSDGVVLVLNANELQDLTNDTDTNDMIEVGLRGSELYSGSTIDIGSPGGGTAFMGGGFGGPTFLPGGSGF